MESFWLNHDISVNLSECEGCSMSMLESMSAGVVPVYTDVFSTRHFIEDGKNGFVVAYNDIEKWQIVSWYWKRQGQNGMYGKSST